MANGVWTKEFQGFLRVRTYGLVSPGIATIWHNNSTIPTSNAGTDVSATNITPLRFGKSDDPTTTNLAVRFGTGTSTPSADNTNLGSTLTLTYVNTEHGAYSIDRDAGLIYRTIKVTVQNPSGTKTISEWGIFGLVHGYFTEGSTSSSDKYVLLYRELLDNPVTLNQYESATLELTITLNLTLEA